MKSFTVLLMTMLGVFSLAEARHSKSGSKGTGFVLFKASTKDDADYDGAQYDTSTDIPPPSVQFTDPPPAACLSNKVNPLNIGTPAGATKGNMDSLLNQHSTGSGKHHGKFHRKGLK